MIPISEDELKRIVELANSVPENYRLKCFELLLGQALQVTTGGLPPPTIPKPIPPVTSQPIQTNFLLPIDVKAFLNQYRLNESLLWKCFHIEGNEIRPIYHLKTHKKARAQIELALMMSLQSAMASGQFQVTTEELRIQCKDYKCYDAPNFNKNLRTSSKLFKSVENDEPLSLSPEGKSELALLLEELNGQDG